MENILTAINPIIIGLGAAGAAAAGAFAYSRYAENLKNKQIGIIGLPLSGKTTLYRCLVYNKLPKKTEQTLYTEKSKDITLKDLEIKVDIVDTPRNITEYNYEGEIKQVLECDIILYLFDISKLFTATEKDEYLKRINKEIEFYSNKVLKARQEEIDKEIEKENKERKYIPDIVSNLWRDFNKSGPSNPKEKIFIALGTHSDKLSKDDKDHIQEITNDLFKFNFECKNDIRYLNSLVDEKQREETVNVIFEILKNFVGDKK